MRPQRLEEGDDQGMVVGHRQANAVARAAGIIHVVVVHHTHPQKAGIAAGGQVVIIVRRRVRTNPAAVAADIDADVAVGGRVAAVIILETTVGQQRIAHEGVAEELGVVAGDAGVEQQPDGPAVHRRVTDGGHARPVLQGGGLVFKIGLTGRDHTVASTSCIPSKVRPRGTLTQCGSRRLAVLDVVLAGHGIARANARHLADGRPGVKGIAKFDNAGEYEQQDGNNDGEFNKSLRF